LTNWNTPIGQPWFQARSASPNAAVDGHLVGGQLGQPDAGAAEGGGQLAGQTQPDRALLAVDHDRRDAVRGKHSGCSHGVFHRISPARALRRTAVCHQHQQGASTRVTKSFRGKHSADT
jgi:hypothetical protein